MMLVCSPAQSVALFTPALTDILGFSLTLIQSAEETLRRKFFFLNLAVSQLLEKTNFVVKAYFSNFAVS